MTVAEKIEAVINDQMEKGYQEFIVYPYGITGGIVREILRKNLELNR